MTTLDVTPWYPRTIKPARTGMYQVQLSKPCGGHVVRAAYYSHSRGWLSASFLLHLGSAVQAWRGLTSNEKPKVTLKRSRGSLNPTAEYVRYVCKGGRFVGVGKTVELAYHNWLEQLCSS